MKFASPQAPPLLLAGWLLVGFSGTLALKPPVWPSAFSVKFREKSFNVFLRPFQVENDGAWYYDYSAQRARHDHMQGQNNTFCQGRGLNLTDPHGECSLLFVDNKDMYVHYTKERQCCRACGAAEGCTMMPSTYLSEATNEANETLNGTACIGWYIPPGEYPINNFYFAESGAPCFWQTVPIVHPFIVSSHSCTFNQYSYHVGPIRKHRLYVPKYCMKDCPNPYHGTHPMKNG